MRREACEDDGRGAEVALTPTRARACCARRGRATWPASGRSFLERFDDDELARLAAMLGAGHPAGGRLRP